VKKGSITKGNAFTPSFLMKLLLSVLEKPVKIFDGLAQLFLFLRLRVQISDCKSVVATAAVRKPGC